MLIAGDYDNDGKDEMACIKKMSNGDFIVEIEKEGRYSDWKNVEFNSFFNKRSISGCYFHDVDGDGYKEMLLPYIDKSDRTLKWRMYGKKNGMASTYNMWQIDGQKTIPPYVFGDFNGDGKIEIAVFTSSGSYLLE